MKIRIPEAVCDYYTDILAHSFEPARDSKRLAAGTTNGKIIVLERNSETNEAFSRLEFTLPNSSAVLGVYWGLPGIFVSSKSLLYLFRPDPNNGDFDGNCQQPTAKFECMFDVQDVHCLSTGATIFGACDDCKVRAWDVETQKLVMEFSDHKMPVEVCRANNEFLVSGGQDGNVVVYDGLLRSPKPVTSFDQGKAAITGLDISRNSTWVAAGSKESPVVYNLQNSAILPQIRVEKPQKIYTVHFDASNTLWWAGGGGNIFKSKDLMTVSNEMKANYGDATIHHVYSITTTHSHRLSVAGASTGILFSENSEFWDGMVHI